MGSLLGAFIGYSILMSLYYFRFLGEKIKVYEKWNDLLKVTVASQHLNYCLPNAKLFPFC